MYGIATKFKTFLKSDNSGAVTAEWTVLTGLLVAMSASIGTVATGVNMAADVIEMTVEAPGNGIVSDLSGEETFLR